MCLSECFSEDNQKDLKDIRVRFTNIIFGFMVVILLVSCVGINSGTPGFSSDGWFFVGASPDATWQASQIRMLITCVNIWCQVLN